MCSGGSSVVSCISFPANRRRCEHRRPLMFRRGSRSKEDQVHEVEALT